MPYDAERLREFREACDIVEYGAFRPQREDAENALTPARAFVDATAAAATRVSAQRAVAQKGKGQAA